MLQTLRVLPTLHLEAKDARGRLPHPTWMRSGRRIGGIGRIGGIWALICWPG
jgi:hypothetical protein